MKQQTHNLSYFPANFFFFFGDDGSQNMLVFYQPTLDMLKKLNKLKKDKGTDYVFNQKSKRGYASKI